MYDPICVILYKTWASPWTYRTPISYDDPL